jgi:hypothetical protein
LDAIQCDPARAAQGIAPESTVTCSVAIAAFSTMVRSAIASPGAAFSSKLRFGKVLNRRAELVEEFAAAGGFSAGQHYVKASLCQGRIKVAHDFERRFAGRAR